jgi:hypothetical protein
MENKLPDILSVFIWPNVSLYWEIPGNTNPFHTQQSGFIYVTVLRAKIIKLIANEKHRSA